MVTALLAALFVLVTLRPGSATASSRMVRRLVTAWIAQNLVLVFSAALRTWDYVEAYSLTVLRLSALLWMALVAAGLALVWWRMLAGKSASWLINANLASAGLLLTGVCFVDLAAVSATWNVRHAKEIDGDGAGLDLCYLDALRGSAVPALIELDQRHLPGQLGADAGSLRNIAQERARLWRDRGGWNLLLDRRLAQASAAPASTDAHHLPDRCDERD